MNRILAVAALALAAHGPLRAQDSTARNATREKLSQLLREVGPRSDVNVAFRQSTKQPYNFTGVMRAGLTNADELEIVIAVTDKETIGFRVYPHYKDAYINIDKARNSAGLVRKLLNMSDHTFLFWGADDTGDVFAGYSFTLESGFPSESVTMVIRSIRNLDKFVGELRPLVDGSFAPEK